MSKLCSGCLELTSLATVGGLQAASKSVHPQFFPCLLDIQMILDLKHAIIAEK